MIINDTTSHLITQGYRNKVEFEYLSVYVRTQLAFPDNRYSSKVRTTWTLGRNPEVLVCVSV